MAIDDVRNYRKIVESNLPHQLAEEHWEWVVRWLEMVYKDAFIHGYKHGMEKTNQKEGEIEGESK